MEREMERSGRKRYTDMKAYKIKKEKSVEI
jgi:hypothetical protein